MRGQRAFNFCNIGLGYSIQRDCGLMSSIGGQSIMAMAHGPHMECSRKEVIAEDTCHDEMIYMPVLHQAIPFIRF